MLEHVERVEFAPRQEAPLVKTVGPVFGTTTKDTGYSAVGLDLVREAASVAGARQLPVVAIGGITLERAASVIEAGATSVAVITDLLVGRGSRQDAR